ncbi:hypothetical protein SLEP1_g11773 [Rubroshorea leprosula]|nr:hypothetical protein SLEP1_g11773 [Rubroshorea leprosula]
MIVPSSTAFFCCNVRIPESQFPYNSSLSDNLKDILRAAAARWLLVFRGVPVSLSDLKMALVLGTVINSLGSIVRILWCLQERRFSATFNAVRSATASLTMALMVCLSAHGIRTSTERGVFYI